MHVGFIGLGSAGGSLAGTLVRNGIDLTVFDLDAALVDSFVQRGCRFDAPLRRGDHLLALTKGLCCRP